ncbi:MAG: TRAP transporter substrate-binding protein [Lachnospiraceae bacterium]
MRKKICKALVCVALGVLGAISLSGCAEKNKEDDVIKIRIAHDNNVQTPVHKSFLKFEKLVEERSNHKLDVVIFPGAQMGSVSDTFEQTRRGDIEMSATTTSNFTAAIPEFAVWESFYMFDDTAHAKRVLDGEVGQKMMEPLGKMDLTGIGYMELGFRNFSNSKRPIVKPEDLKGLKMRGYNPLQIKAWTAVGTNPTSVSWNELFTSLQQKLIDGQECATNSFYTEKFYEAQKYWSLTKHVFTNFLWYANEEFMDSLSEENQKIIREAAKEAIDYNWELVDETENSVLESLEKEGFAVNEVDLKVRRELGEKMNVAIKEDIIKQCGPEIYDTVFAAVEAERQE